MSFGDLESGRRAKQWCGEDSSFAQAIRANVVEMQTRMRGARLLLEQVRKVGKAGCLSKRIDESLRKSLCGSEELAEKTEQLFREWTVHLAGEPATRQKRKLAYEKLQKAFGDEVDSLKDLHRQANKARKEFAARSKMCEDQGSVLGDEKQSLLAGSEVTGTEDVGDVQLLQSCIAQEREDGVKRISSQVVDVNQMFRDLASMVHEQDHQFETIEQHAKSASSNSSLAVKELKKTSDRNRIQLERIFCLMCSAMVVFCFVLVSNPRLYALEIGVASSFK